MSSPNKVAVALALDDTAAALGALRRLGRSIGLAEIRLDGMNEFDLRRLIEESPVPLVITCRPVREGGLFQGEESRRLEILTEASDLGCAFVDLEWDCVEAFAKPRSATRTIVSRHFYDRMPTNLHELYLAMRDKADVVKLVGAAGRASETIPVFELIASAESPIIAIAMGQAGIPTRLIAPCFDHCVLTFGALDDDRETAPGQLTVSDMVQRYALHRVSEQTHIEVLLFTGNTPAPELSGQGNGETLRVPVQVKPDELESFCAVFAKLGPRVATRIVEDP